MSEQIQKVRVSALAHVGVWSSDIVNQTQFYHQIMSLDLRDSSKEGVEVERASTFLALGEKHHCLALFNDTRPNASNGRKPAQRSQLHHLAFEVNTNSELAALAARLKMSGVEPHMEARDGDLDMDDALWFSDPDGNRIEVLVKADELSAYSSQTKYHRALLRPYALQHVALQTSRLEEMTDFYTEMLGFDISDWLLRECVWLRCNNNHHTLIFMPGKQNIDSIGYTIADGSELLHWSDYLSQHQTPILWGPGRHGAGQDLFVRFADPEGIHIELSAGLQQYYDSDVTTPPRLWHTRVAAHNLWGILPAWMREEARV